MRNRLSRSLAGLASLSCLSLFAKSVQAAPAQKDELTACALLTPEAAVRIAKVPVKQDPPAKGDMAAFYAKLRCAYHQSDRQAFGVRITLEVVRMHSKEAEDNSWRNLKAYATDPANKGRMEVVNGLSDDAFLFDQHPNDKKYFHYILHVRKGNAHFLLSADDSVRSPLEDMKAVAKEIVEHL